MAPILRASAKCQNRRAVIEPSEKARRELVVSVNTQNKERSALEAKYGDVYDTQQVQDLYRIEGFLSPFVLCMRKSDGKRGTLMFTHSPRYYFGFEEE